MTEQGAAQGASQNSSSALARCEHGRTVQQPCRDCADPAYDVPCDHCGAQAGFGCVTRRGRILTPMHDTRRDTYRAKNEPSGVGRG